MGRTTNGYVMDVGYSFGYHTALNPLHARLTLLLAGYSAPHIETACEPGFGQGVSLNIHAAASRVAWQGNDINPAHAAFAQDMANAANSSLTVTAETFAALTAREPLPSFDYIALHGVWSWIDAATRQQLTQLIDRTLKPGGIAYVSYNALPGQAAITPLQELLSQHAHRTQPPSSNTADDLQEAVTFAQQVLDSADAFNQAFPDVRERLASLSERDRRYVIHEYLNRNWAPMSVIQVADALADAHLDYACSSHLLEHVDALHLSPEQTALLNTIDDALLREFTRDMFVNQRFRADYWVKGARTLTPAGRVERLRSERVVLTQPADQVPLRVQGFRGAMSLQASTYQPLLDSLADHTPRTIGELERQLCDNNLSIDHLLEAITVLVGSNVLAPANDPATIDTVRPGTTALNAFICSHARTRDEIRHLASPVTGGGIACDRFQQLFLLAIANGHTTPYAWADYVWDIMAPQGQYVVHRGTSLVGDAQNRAALLELAEWFADQEYPILRALHVSD